MLLASCEVPKGKTPEPQTKPFLIAIIGNGVPKAEEPRERELPKDTASGVAMYNGAEAAFTNSPRLKELRSVAQLASFDDGANPKTAAEIARKIQVDPRILAVIGHTTSPATRAAAYIYAQAGIPLLMPIATSPSAVLPPGTDDETKRLRNTFRLAPSDDRVQGPAVAILASQLGTHCYLLGDISSPAISDYSGPLFSYLQSRLEQVGILSRHMTMQGNNTNILSLASTIHTAHPDVIIFCGYGSTAAELLDALRKEYEIDSNKKRTAKPEIRPKIILTDGCKIGTRLDTTGFEVYLTFPLPQTLSIAQQPAPTKSSLTTISKPPSTDADFLSEAITKQGVDSYQMYAYDAMLMIGQAVKVCTGAGTISRDCVRDRLNQIENFPGASLVYSLKAGENVLAKYYVYSNLKDPTQLLMDHSIEPEEIQNQTVPTKTTP